MNWLAWLGITFAALFAIILLFMSIRIVRQYEHGVHFRLGRVIGVLEPGLH